MRKISNPKDLKITNYHGVPEGKSMIIIFYWMDTEAYHGFSLVGSRRMGPLGCAASQGFRGRSQAIETALRLNPNCQHSAPLKLSLSSTELFFERYLHEIISRKNSRNSRKILRSPNIIKKDFSPGKGLWELYWALDVLLPGIFLRLIEKLFMNKKFILNLASFEAFCKHL